MNALTRARRVDAEHPAVLLAMAEVLRGQEEIARAREQVEILLAVEPEHVDGLYLSATLSLMEGDLAAGDAKGIVDSIPPIVSNLLHIPLFAGLAFLLLLTFSNGRWKSPASNKTYAMVFGAATLYAISDELHQSFVPGRSASIADVGLDVIGIATVVLLHRKQRRGQ